MENLQLKHVPITKTGMLIRRPVAEVFEAFINPDITTKFWFTKGSGRLGVSKQVQWDWEMYNISIPVTGKAIEENKLIRIEWPGYSGLTTVEWTFAAQEAGTTFVNITESGFTGDGDELVKQVTASTQGFTLVLAGLKAFLEHNIRLNLVADVIPRELQNINSWIMEIRYINTDLELESNEDLNPIIEALGKDVLVLHHGPVQGMNHASVELSSDHSSDPDEVIGRYCDLIENLPKTARKIWDNCLTRIIDIGVESGSSPKSYRFEVRQPIMNRVSAIGASLAVTIYAMQVEED